MYYNNRKLFLSIFWIILGAVLLFLRIFNIISDFWQGIAMGLIFVGILQVIRNFKYRNNESYKEKVDIAYSDERNKYLRMKAWSFSAYIFLFSGCIASLVFSILGYKDYALILYLCYSFILILYLVLLFIFSKKE